MATKNVLKKKSFAEIVNFKACREIKHNGEVIFSLCELSNGEFSELVKFVFQLVDEDKAQNIEQEILPLLLRKMFKSDGFDIGDMTDEELLQTVNNFGQEIGEQVDLALRDLAIDRINAYINNLINSFKIENPEEEVENPREGE